MSTDPDQIRSEIDQTQRELSADVDALTEKISPPRIVERRVRAHPRGDDEREGQDHGQHIGRLPDGRLRHGTSGIGGERQRPGFRRAGHAPRTRRAPRSSAADTVRSAPDTVRRRATGNPIAAGLVAFGAGWLLSSLLPASEPEQQVATQVKDFAAEQGRPVAKQLGEAGPAGRPGAAASPRSSAPNRSGRRPRTPRRR